MDSISSKIADDNLVNAESQVEEIQGMPWLDEASNQAKPKPNLNSNASNPEDDIIDIITPGAAKDQKEHGSKTRGRSDRALQGGYYISSENPNMTPGQMEQLLNIVSNSNAVIRVPQDAADEQSGSSNSFVLFSTAEASPAVGLGYTSVPFGEIVGFGLEVGALRSAMPYVKSGAQKIPVITIATGIYSYVEHIYNYTVNAPEGSYLSAIAGNPMLGSGNYCFFANSIDQMCFDGLLPDNTQTESQATSSGAISNLESRILDDEDREDYNNLYKKKNSGNNKPNLSNNKDYGILGTPIPDPGDFEPDDEDDYKKTGFKKGDYVDLKRFNARFEGNKYKDPRTGHYIQKDNAVNSGAGGHGGSYFKLFDKFHRKIGTFTKDGKFLR